MTELYNVQRSNIIKNPTINKFNLSILKKRYLEYMYYIFSQLYARIWNEKRKNHQSTIKQCSCRLKGAKRVRYSISHKKQ